MRITREQAEDMADAHAQGLHDELPREGCPECEGRELRDYPRAEQPDHEQVAAELGAKYHQSAGHYGRRIASVKVTPVRPAGSSAVSPGLVIEFDDGDELIVRSYSFRRRPERASERAMRLSEGE